MNNTMNYNPKGYCDVAHNSTSHLKAKLNHRMWQNRQWYNNQAACHHAGFQWFEISHSQNIIFANNSFVCAHTQFSRTNQLGNARSDLVVSQSEFQAKGLVKNAVNEGVNANRFLWTIPEIPKVYNQHKYFPAGMASAYKSCTLRMRYNVSSADFQQWPVDAVDAGTPKMVDHFNNSRRTGDPRTPLKQDPYVYIGPGDRYAL